MQNQQTKPDSDTTDPTGAFKALYSETFDAWKRIYSQAETAWTTALGETIASAEFAKGMAATREGYLNLSDLSRQALDKTWEQLHIPTVSDVARVAELIVGVEEKLETMNDRLESASVLLQRIEEIVSGMSAQGGQTDGTLQTKARTK